MNQNLSKWDFIVRELSQIVLYGWKENANFEIKGFSTFV